MDKIILFPARFRKLRLLRENKGEWVGSGRPAVVGAGSKEHNWEFGVEAKMKPIRLCRLRSSHSSQVGQLTAKERDSTI